MISTLYFFQFLAFYLWQLTSKQMKRKQLAGYLTVVAQNQSVSRWLGVVIFITTIILFVAKLGLMSGVCAAIIGLMGVGCLSVALEPFKYLRVASVALLYAVSLTLEILI